MKRIFVITCLMIVLAALLGAADYLQFSYNNQGLPGVPAIGGTLQWYTVFIVPAVGSVELIVDTTSGPVFRIAEPLFGYAIFIVALNPHDITEPPIFITMNTAAVNWDSADFLSRTASPPGAK